MVPLVDIKKLREARGWTQDDMAKRFGVNKATIWRWENKGIPERGPSRKAIEREFLPAAPPEEAA